MLESTLTSRYENEENAVLRISTEEMQESIV